MQSLRRSVRFLKSIGSSRCPTAANSLSTRDFFTAINGSSAAKTHVSSLSVMRMASNEGFPSLSLLNQPCCPGLLKMGAVVPPFPSRGMTTEGHRVEAPSHSSGAPAEPPARIKFKRLDKTAKHIMQIIDKEATEEVNGQREIPNIKPGYIIQLKVEVPENKRRVSILKGIVIARRNAGLNTTFRLRRLVAGVGVESLFPLYSPNIKEIKVLDKKKVRRAKLYYLRERMNPLKKK
ncbi:50S ribosomal protein L19-2, chloroplastic-like [Punica granatum]|uniref:50S ribosomal protein L19-2, chloroplastic-like n=1 Tax=Punica granatum TaxID=22663 RepID=A0A6P8EQU0_PUNGR|nr:50S ribosomal protein L19-2, chloroplastic-like [Punica granatum]